MRHSLLTVILEDELLWLAPYAWGVVILGIGSVILRAIYKEVAASMDWVHFKNPLFFKKLPLSRKQILEKEFEFYHKISRQDQKLLEHRTAKFISDKKFVSQEGLEMNERYETLIAATACMLGLGRRNYLYGYVENVLVFPGHFTSIINGDLHKGEFNPMQRAIVFAWPDFEEGYQITNDKLNLGIHEFMHAMHIEAMQSTDVDSQRFVKYFKKMFAYMREHETIRQDLIESKYFRDYAYTNAFEFMSVLAEYFFESPVEFQQRFPVIYNYMAKILNFRYPSAPAA